MAGYRYDAKADHLSVLVQASHAGSGANADDAAARGRAPRRRALPGAGRRLRQLRKWHSIDVSGSLPPLSFTMARAADGKETTEAEYRGKIVLLYFGYTNCPDQGPTTLSNVADILHRLGPVARRVRMLFIIVDPNRDTLPVLAAYVKNFAPQIEGLGGPRTSS